MSTRGRAAAARVRRTRLLVAAAVVLGGAVLVTGMPVSALLTQRHQLGQASTRLASLDAANRQLSSEAKALQNPQTVSGLARTEYGLVPAGQKAYVILPPAGSSAAAVAGSGHVPLEGPVVVPGSLQSELLLGVGSSSASANDGAGSTNAQQGSSSHHAAPKGHSSFWSRVLHTLEFWH